MHGETQANRLAQLMQKKGNLPAYELALPLIMVRTSSLEQLEIDDVLLLGLNSLEYLLIDKGEICAQVMLVKQDSRYVLQILRVQDKVRITNESRKYTTFKLSFGMVHSRVLKVGHTIDLAQINLEKVFFVFNENKIVTATLITVDGEIAVKINKVERNG